MDTKKLTGLLGLFGGPQQALLLAGISQALVLYRKARDAWKAAHADPNAPPDPNDPVWLSDEELISHMAQDSQALMDHAARLLDKYKAADPPPQG